MKAELFLEIGTEEIPARFIPQALKDMKELLKKALKENRIGYGEVKSFGTPRRLILLAQEVALYQEGKLIENLGPPKKIAFDEKGDPTTSAIGFAQRFGISPQDLIVVDTPKGEYLCARKREEGKETKEILPFILPRLITSIPFPKSMRWASEEIRFARPIHWILALFQGEVIPFRLGNIESANFSYGHPFMGKGAFKVTDFSSFKEEIRERFVIIDPEERKKLIKEKISQKAKDLAGRILEDEELLEILTYLVEYPSISVGSFDKEFLDLPREVLISAMKEHQKYFPVEDLEGNLLPYFIIVSNTEVKDPEVVVKGNERVIKARLSDAGFFFEEDKKTPLWKRAESLRGVLFHFRLGSLYDKVLRLEKLAEYIACEIDLDIKEVVKRAAYLSKADLVTQMVGEFPKLQGVMGRIYALAEGVEEVVAKAIEEHHLPNFGKDKLPATLEGTILSIADKLDNIVGFIGTGLAPTGDEDPYGLRRQALGIINIILEGKISLRLSPLIGKSIELLDLKEEVKEKVLEFFKIRFQNYLLAQGYSYDIVDSIIAFDNLRDAWERAKSLEEMKLKPQWQSLLIAFRRVARIIAGFQDGEIDPSLFSEPEEKALYESLVETKGSIARLFSQMDYSSLLVKLAELRKPIDNFFDRVLVMTDLERIRRNRLALLSQVGNLFFNFANFSKIVIE